MLKKIIKNLKPSSTLRINEISNKLQSEGKKIYKFGFGQSPFPVPSAIQNELQCANSKCNSKVPIQSAIQKCKLEIHFKRTRSIAVEQLNNTLQNATHLG